MKHYEETTKIKGGKEEAPPILKHRKIFSELIEVQTAKLPRLKPHISIDRRTLERSSALSSAK